MSAPRRLHRHREIEQIKNDLERKSFPRLQMGLLVALTGSAGLLASSVLLHFGLREMWVRYLAAFGVAYAAFLFLLWLWLRNRAGDFIDHVDLPDYADLVPSSSGSSSGCASAESIFSGKGGAFDGGGASGLFEGRPANGLVGNPASIADTGASGDSVLIGDSIGGALDSIADADEIAIPLALIALVGALLLSSFAMIYSAPVLFAELIVDGVLSASLYHRLRGLETHHWLETALRRTIWPFMISAAVVSAAGWVMAQYAPQAHSIGAVIHHLKAQ